MKRHLTIEKASERLGLDIKIDKQGFLSISEHKGFKIKKYFKIFSETMDKGFLQFDRFFTYGTIKYKDTKQFKAEGFSFDLYDYDPITKYISDNNLNAEEYLEANEKFDSVLGELSKYIQIIIPTFMKDANIDDVLDIFGRFEVCKLDSVFASDDTEYALIAINYAPDVKKKYHSLYKKVLKNPFSYLYCQTIPKVGNYKFITNYGRGDYTYNYCLQHYKDKMNDQDNFLLTLPYRPSDLLRDMVYILTHKQGLSNYSNTEGEVKDWYYFLDTRNEHGKVTLKIPYTEVDKMKELEFILTYNRNNEKRTVTIPYEYIVLQDSDKILGILQ